MLRTRIKGISRLFYREEFGCNILIEDYNIRNSIIGWLKENSQFEKLITHRFVNSSLLLFWKFQRYK